MDVVRLPVLIGPTAAGKTAAAELLSSWSSLLVLSADSRQVYRHFDIGTAKPSVEQVDRTPHVGVDVAEPTERFSAAQWAALADPWLARAENERRVPLIVGGTGFYMRALFAPLFAEPSLEPTARRELQASLAHLSTEDLRARVQLVDPARAHLGRTQLLRAIEVQVLTGIPISQWHVSNASAPRFAPDYLVIDARQSLLDRIAQRLDGMFRSGWVDEVRRLMESVPHDAPAWNATGYSAIRELVEGRIDEHRAREQVLIGTRQYAKRQRTWCRHQLQEPLGRTTQLDTDSPTFQDELERWWSEVQRP